MTEALIPVSGFPLSGLIGFPPLTMPADLRAIYGRVSVCCFLLRFCSTE
jgi:hypothetical protein